MAARKHDASIQAEGTGAPAGGANRLHLRMRGRIVRGRNLIDPGREHLAILDQHRAERPAPTTPAGWLAREIYRGFNDFSMYLSNDAHT